MLYLINIDMTAGRIDVFDLVERLHLGKIRKIEEIPLQGGVTKNVILNCASSSSLKPQGMIHDRLRCGETLKLIDSQNVWKYWTIRIIV